LSLCAVGEHFWEYRVLAKQRITQQLGYDPTITPEPSEAQPVLVRL